MHAAPRATASSAPQRPLTLTPLAFDVVLALSQRRGGTRLGDLAALIASPVSSVQTSLRVLMANGIVRRVVDRSPTYALDRVHHAVAALQNLSAILPEPEHALEIIARSNPAVEFAAIDRLGVVIAVRERADPIDVELLDSTIETAVSARARRPPVLRLAGPELARRLGADPDLRHRLIDAPRIKGQLPAFGSRAKRG